MNYASNPDNLRLVADVIHTIFNLPDAAKNSICDYAGQQLFRAFSSTPSSNNRIGRIDASGKQIGSREEGRRCNCVQMVQFADSTVSSMARSRFVAFVDFRTSACTVVWQGK